MEKSTVVSEVTSLCGQINSIEDSVRKFINTNRYQTSLIKDSSNWNQICSSLDTIGDTTLSILDYAKAEFPQGDGLKYIYIYGILQALFIQQDAIKHLSEAFSLEYEATESLKKIRQVRNAAIGHPTKNTIQKVNYYNYISRISLQKWGFTLLRSPGNGSTDFSDISLEEIMLTQLKEVAKAYSSINEKLGAIDKMHKSKFNNPLSNLFHSSIGYLFEKVSEGIHSPESGNRNFGLKMLESIEATYKSFVEQLKDRNEFNQYTEHDLGEYFHAINKLKTYFTSNEGNLTETDARIYCYYLREEHNRFVQIAEEIDEEYSKNAPN